jgi:pterin-4a-carbinolamine dehydratase
VVSPSGTGRTPAAATAPPGWEAGERPPLLFRRFEFGSYAETRVFLDRLAALSQRAGLYPDLSFASRHVNVTIRGRDGGALGDAERAFAVEAAALGAAEAG